MKINVNADKLFATINTIDELKETANYVVTEIKNAYTARVAELLAQMDGDNELLTVAATDDTKAAKGEVAAKAKAAKARKNTIIAKTEAKANAQTTATATVRAAKGEAKADAKAAKATTKAAKGEVAAKAKAATKADAQTANTESEKTAKVEQVKIASLTKKQITAMGIHFEQYSEKCMFMTGETKCIKDEIKAIGGAHWNSARKGWFIKNDNAKTLAKALKIKLA